MITSYLSLDLTLSISIHHGYLHPLQTVNCCHNSRRVVDEDGLKLLANEKNSIVIMKTVSIKIFVLKAIGIQN